MPQMLCVKFPPSVDVLLLQRPPRTASCLRKVNRSEENPASSCSVCMRPPLILNSTPKHGTLAARRRGSCRSSGLLAVVAHVLPLGLCFAATQVVHAVLVVPSAGRIGRRLVHRGLLHAIEIDVGLARAHVVDGVHVDPGPEDPRREEGLAVLMKLAAVLRIGHEHEELEHLMNGG